MAYHSSRILDDDIARYKSLQQDLELCPVSGTISEMDADEGKINKLIYLKFTFTNRSFIYLLKIRFQ